MISFDRLFRIANRLGQVSAGSAEADHFIHDVLGRAGPVLPYTTETSAAEQLLPPGFEWMPSVHSAGKTYAACCRSGLAADGLSHPHIGHWGRTVPLAICGAALRAWALVVRG
ncbi:hypothetical protein [Belnapia rosea]|uniref:hypothetical protein n=1 Tax=Belnapia rosea TaxID=938405 RepID=UPI000B808701|nr:hypothetical protein [Belnapia rosea]